MQKSRIPKTSLFIMVIILGMLVPMAGCIFPVKVESLSWPGVQVRTEVPLYHIGPIRHWSIYFRPGKGTTKFSIQMPDGRILKSDQLTREALEPYVTPFAELIHETHLGWAEWSVIEYNNGQVRVYFENRQATRVNAMVLSHRSVRPEQPVLGIGNCDGTKVFPLPITEDELIELFGEPTEARTYLFNT